MWCGVAWRGMAWCIIETCGRRNIIISYKWNMKLNFSSQQLFDINSCPESRKINFKNYVYTCTVCTIAYIVSVVL